MGNLLSKSKSFALLRSPASKNEGQDEVQEGPSDDSRTIKEQRERHETVPSEEREEELSSKHRKVLHLADMSTFESNVSLAGSDHDLKEREDMLEELEFAENAME
ncbi:hypothetical protein M514_08005 [Trichuris suis]|uniref:Uncharacterized protein n=1 Tax=Trichuris suis TaxID=68888 RepID=A0A085M1K9_9BILA|nr:hypothetical protein M513_08005 [Trichuris suis]KFD63075.1 hypothetical protein M514_08005 [Trichuris suis]KHJ46225.1 hypothetical protein D918_03273 [Trichuris suis]